MMNRRTFLWGLTLGALGPPLTVEAQQAGSRVPRVGVLLQGDPSAPIVLRLKESVSQGFREHGGYVNGQNIVIEYAYADLDGLRSSASDLVRDNVDVIVAGGTPAAIAARRATTTIPIVAGAM